MQPQFKIIPFDQLLDAPDIEFVRAGGVDRAHAARLALSIRAAYGLYPTTLGLFAHELPLAEPARDRKGCYYLRAGYHRRAALRLLAEGGVVEVDGAPVEFTPDARWAAGVPCVIADHTSNLDAAIGSNTHQKALNPVEAARAAQYLRDNGYSLAEAAQVINKSESATSNLIRLLALPAPVLDLIAQGVLTERHGRALLWLAEHLPDVLQRYIDAGGEDLWCTSAIWMTGRTDQLVDAARDLALLTVEGTERRVEFVVMQNSWPLTIWPLDWEPEWPPDWNPADDLPGEEHVVRAGSCARCPATADWRRERRCLDKACHKGRFQMYMAQVERTRQDDPEQAARLEAVAQVRAPAEYVTPAARPADAEADDDAHETAVYDAEQQVRAPAEYVTPAARPADAEADDDAYETAVYDAEQQARTNAMKASKRALLDAIWQAPDPAALLVRPAVLQWVHYRILHPGGWGDLSNAEPAVLAREILCEIAGYITRMNRRTPEKRAALLDGLAAIVRPPEPDGDPPAPDAPDDESIDDFLARVGGHTGTDEYPVHIRADARQPTLCGLDDPPGRRAITVRYAQMKRRAGDLDGVCADCLAALEALPDPPTLVEQEEAERA